jgi:hypothetical protein
MGFKVPYGIWASTSNSVWNSSYFSEVVFDTGLKKESNIHEENIETLGK